MTAAQRIASMTSQVSRSLVKGLQKCSHCKGMAKTLTRVKIGALYQRSLCSRCLARYNLPETAHKEPIK